jgi:hypothetical protein
VYPLPPPIPIPDWRGFERGDPNSSQIGVDFSDSHRFGVGLKVLLFGFP